MASNGNLIFFLLSEIIFFSCSHIVYHYVNRIKYYRYAIVKLNDDVLSSQG